MHIVCDNTQCSKVFFFCWAIVFESMSVFEKKGGTKIHEFPIVLENDSSWSFVNGHILHDHETMWNLVNPKGIAML